MAPGTNVRVPDLSSQEFRRLLAKQLRVWAYRLERGDRLPDEREKTFEDILSRLETLLQDDRIYLDPTLSLEALASKVGTNRTYMLRALKLRGETFSNYINALRLDHATDLMRRHQSMDLSEIAERSGFSSQRSLNYLILKKYGFTLAAFRRRISQLLSALPEGQIPPPCRKGELRCLPQR